jgi:hypothetical protein
MRTPSPRIVIAAVLGGVLAVIWIARPWVGSAQSRSPIGESPSMAPTRPSLDMATQIEPDRAVLHVPRKPTARESLVSFWGELTPEAEARIRGEGIDLDIEYEVPAWEDVADHIRVQLCDLTPEQLEALRKSEREWPDVLTADALREQFPIVGQRKLRIDEAVLAEVDALAAEHNARIGLKTADLVQGIQFALRESWASNAVQKSPITTQAIPPDTRVGFYASACAHNGWAARVKLESDRYPELVRLKSEIAALCRDRDAKVVHYLASLPN